MFFGEVGFCIWGGIEAFVVRLSLVSLFPLVSLLLGYIFGGGLYPGGSVNGAQHRHMTGRVMSLGSCRA
jgi:hypothetical protein